MTQAVIHVDARNKRRLPIWMMQVNAADAVRIAGNGKENCSLAEEQPRTLAVGSKKKSIVGKRDKAAHQEANTADQTETLRGVELQQRTGKATRRDEGSSNSISTCHGAKKKLKKELGDKRKVYETHGTEKQHVKNKRSKSSNVKVLSQEKSYDEVELTVEDLVSIAEEYVNADREKQQERSASGESTSEANPLCLPISSKANMKGPPLDVGSGQIMSKCTTARSSSQLIETKGKENDSPRREHFATNITRTGDVAQDMLDLLLGPLLKKPLPKAQDLGAIESEGLTMFHESSKQTRSREVLIEKAALTKKKSSLKDKVSMFLD